MMNSIESTLIESTLQKSKQNTNHSEALPTDSGQFAYTQTRIQSPHGGQQYKNRLITAFKPGKWLESHKMLRTRCLQLMDTMEWNTVAITSPTSNSGNSLTAANLAISMAMELDRSVLLIDANFQNPSICKLFDINAEIGLSDYLLSDTPLNEILINPDLDRLVILPAGQAMFNSTEMLRSPRMIRLVAELKARYPTRIIIFDMPPMLSQADTLGFSPYVDCVLLVIEEGHTKTDELKHAVTLLKDINILGTVFNKASDNRIKYQPN